MISDLDTLEIKINVYFHPVGHGLFSSIDFNLGNNRSGTEERLSVIYDCGSLSRTDIIERAITDYISGRNNGSSNRRNNVDLLILSHMHKDHVIGMPFLLSKIRANVVMLPYLTPLERLIIAITWVKSISLWDRYDQWYYEFLRDPVSAFFDWDGIEPPFKIIFLTSSRRGHHYEEFDSPPLEPPPKPENYNGKRILENLPEYIEGLEKRFDVSHLPMDLTVSESARELESESFRDYMDRGFIEIRRAYGYSSIMLGTSPIWIVYPYVNQASEDALEKFVRCVEKLAGKNVHHLKSDDLNQLLMNGNSINKLKECYKYIQSDINYTSLVTSQFPALQLEKFLMKARGCPLRNTSFYNWSKAHGILASHCMTISESQDVFYYLVPHSPDSPAILLTGDIPLKTTSIWKEFESYHVWLTNRIEIAQIPHHGAWSGFNRGLEKFLRGSIGVISHGYRYRNNPHPRVIMNLSTYTKQLYSCNDHCGTKFEISNGYLLFSH